MGRICTEQALSMLGHYFGEVPEATKAQLRAVFVDEALSPAELETMVRGGGGARGGAWVVREGRARMVRGGTSRRGTVAGRFETILRGGPGDV